MADYTEEEQVEILRKWWAENGTSALIAIVLAVAAVIGWRQWGLYQDEQAQQASALYQQMQDALEQARSRADSKDLATAVRTSADQLLQDFESTAYADYARLTLARLAVEEGQYEDARARLQEVVDAPATDTLKWVATLRLARVLVAMDDLDAASSLVTAKMPDAFAGQALELQGDILRTRDDLAGARDAYESALEKMQSDAHRELVRMKLQDLAPAS